MWPRSKMSHSDETDQSFFSARSLIIEEDPVTENGSTDADLAAPLMRSASASKRSHILTEEENQAINEKIDSLVAVIQAGRQLHFSPDPQTGNVDISIAHDRSDADDGRSDVEAGILASPENFGNVIRPGGGFQRIPSPSSVSFDSTDASEVMRNFSSSAWENALTPAENRSAVEHVPEAQIPPPVRKDIPGEVHGAVRRDGKYITYWDKDVLKVAAVASIPLEFNKPRRISTPSIHSAGSDLDCSSPLFEKSLQALMRETSRDLTSSDGASQDSRFSGIENSVSDWLEHVETPKFRGEHSDASRERQGFNVFQDSGKHEMALEKDRKPFTVSKALKDVSNLRRPGYLQHNSFAQTSQIDKMIGNPARPRISGPPIQLFAGVTDAESRRSFIEAKWPVLMSNHNSRKTERSTTLHPQSSERLHSSPHIRRRGHEHPSPQNLRLQDPNRTADFDLALAKLEGHAPPQQDSPIRRYADETGLYGPDVLVERRRLRHHQPVPMRSLPLGLSTAQRFEKAVAEGDDDGGENRRRGSE